MPSHEGAKPVQLLCVSMVMGRFLACLLLVACSTNARLDDENEPGAASPVPTAPKPAESKPTTEVPSNIVTAAPTEPVALNAFLQRGDYKTWKHESAAHPSTGPHAASVLTFLDPTLDASLAARTDHPVGAAAVKEFLSPKGEITGWAVEVKLEADSNGGQGWYWYEIFSAKPGASASSQGKGNGVCTGCHSQGRDYVRIPYPLQ